MVAKRTLGLLFAVAIAGAALPRVSEASFANSLGGAYGGKLSNKRTTRTQQLTADPVNVLRGSTSVAYDPEVSSLDNVFGLDQFNITNALVAVTFDNGESEELISVGEFREGGSGEVFHETGYLQVFYQLSEMTGGPHGEVDPGYTVADQDGVTDGDNTFTAFFLYRAENLGTVAKYRLYADNGSRGIAPDSITTIDDPGTQITSIQEANVSSAMVIPLPAALGSGLIGLAGVVIHRMRRRVFA
jgi:hypothetical protein